MHSLEDLSLEQQQQFGPNYSNKTKSSELFKNYGWTLCLFFCRSWTTHARNMDLFVDLQACARIILNFPYMTYVNFWDKGHLFLSPGYLAAAEKSRCRNQSSVWLIMSKCAGNDFKRDLLINRCGHILLILMLVYAVWYRTLKERWGQIILRH